MPISPALGANREAVYFHKAFISIERGAPMLEKMLETTIPLIDEEATTAFGAALAPLLTPGDVICLTGPLGAGKTTLTRGLIKAATGAAEAPSPTFALVETYDAPQAVIWHFDLYRLETAEEIWELGFEEAIDQGICIIEWPERIEAQLPPNPLIIALNPTQTPRQATLRGTGAWEKRLENVKFFNE